MKKFNRLSKKQWGIILAVIVCLVIVMGVIVIRHKSQKTAAKQINYAVVKLQHQVPLTLMGKVQASQTQRLQNPAGKVTNVAVKNGENVSQGQTLLTTYNQTAQDSLNDQQQEIAKLQRSLNSTNTQVKNLQQQLAQLSSSDDNYSDLKQQLTEAQNSAADTQAELTEAQQKKQKTAQKVTGTLTAPFAGTITVNYLANGTPSLQLQGNGMQAVGEVSEYSYKKLTSGTKLKIKAVATKVKTDSQVSFLSTTAASDSQKNDAKYQFTASISGNFIDGQTLKISVPQAGIRVPSAAIYHGKVFVVKGRQVSEVVTISGKKASGFTIVKTGLQAGQKIVNNPDHNLKVGSRVDNDD
ncbi:efflux RND transporter periplasmic adaptor subunit [Liquorilactobacillus sicerae]|uniref:efflux RND transporter periplasmic adaptor subunit n=1 Tax=Liquorilactobacillus sicerae TaxID=1416943 RepID=UPI002480C53E|nr:RND transporter MFP subunit [Liquorilactobacillus sicerae]